MADAPERAYGGIRATLADATFVEGTLLPRAAQSLRACDTMFIVSRFTLAFSARR